MHCVVKVSRFTTHGTQHDRHRSGSDACCWSLCCIYSVSVVLLLYVVHVMTFKMVQLIKPFYCCEKNCVDGPQNVTKNRKANK